MLAKHPLSPHDLNEMMSPMGFPAATAMHTSRQGFTLVELLVAVGIFMFGFSAIYAMFLLGARQRVIADSISTAAYASSSISAEIRLQAGRESATINSAALYEGDGFADAALTPPDSDFFCLLPIIIFLGFFIVFTT